MILIGQYDSSFVRRVGIALKFYGLPFEHRPWSVFSDKEKIRPLNPLIRVPVLVLDDQDVLVDSHLILSHLESLVPAERSLYPAEQPNRHRALKVAGLATGLADKGVSLFYEQQLHKQVSPLWVERCRAQIAGALSMLEEDRAERRTRILVRRSHPARRHCGGLRHPPHQGSPAGRRGDAGLSQPLRALRAAGGDAGLPGDQPALHPASVMPAARVLLGVKGRDCS